MVAYPEEWMGNAESLKSLMGWTDTPITHFRNLAVFGEQLLLSIRWHLWGDEADSNVARDWVNYWKPEIQGYLQTVADRYDVRRHVLFGADVRSARWDDADARWHEQDGQVLQQSARGRP